MRVEPELVPEFNEEQMERLMKKDVLVHMMYKGLKGKKREKLEALFNSLVVGDSHMIKSYEKA